MKLTLALCLILFAAFGGAAQQSKRNVLPRVGEIKDYPATGLMTGCANYYFSFPQRKPVGETPYAFLARSGGNDAWMNLGGRDVRLQQLKAPRHQRARGFKYRLGEIFISVVIKDFKPKPGATGEEADIMFEAVITLRRGRAARTVKLFGHADC